MTWFNVTDALSFDTIESVAGFSPIFVSRPALISGIFYCLPRVKAFINKVGHLILESRAGLFPRFWMAGSVKFHQSNWTKCLRIGLNC